MPHQSFSAQEWKARHSELINGLHPKWLNVCLNDVRSYPRLDVRAVEQQESLRDRNQNVGGTIAATADCSKRQPTRPQVRENLRRTLWGTLRILSNRERSWGPFSAAC